MVRLFNLCSEEFMCFSRVTFFVDHNLVCACLLACDSDAYSSMCSLEGRKISGFNGVKKAVKGALEEGLTRICKSTYLAASRNALEI